MDKNCASCEEYKGVSRRGLFKGGLAVGLGLTAVTTFGDAFVETSYAATGKADNILVVLSLRGAADGLSLMVPHADPVYYQARPGISIPKASLLVPDSFFGLHPAFEPLLPLWSAGKMAAIHATGQIVTTRSHFVAMEEVEDANPGSSTRSGWLNRVVSLRPSGASELNSLQMGSGSLATQLSGSAPALAAPNLDRLKLSGPENGLEEVWRQALGNIWQDSPTVLGGGGSRALSVVDTYAPVLAAPASKVVYPDGDLGKALASVAKVLKADVGAEVVTVDQGSWDHHQWVGNLNDGSLKRMAVPLGLGLKAFFDDLGPLAEKVTVVTISEFGRRVKENANQGLDHGHGNVMFVLGNGVKGGYYASWPGIENTANADLPVTVDYRNVLAEVIKTIYPERSIAQVFPGLTVVPIGFMKGITPPQPDPDPEPEPEPESPAEPTPDPPMAIVPAMFFKTFGKKRGVLRVGRVLVVPRHRLSPAGRRARVRVTYQWRVYKGKKVVRKSSARRLYLRRNMRKHKIVLRITYRAKGFKPRVRTLTYGKVR